MELENTVLKYPKQVVMHKISQTPTKFSERLRGEDLELKAYHTHGGRNGLRCRGSEIEVHRVCMCVYIFVICREILTSGPAA